MYPYAKTANQVWLIARVVLWIACLKWPKLIKLYVYFECVLEALVAMLPSEINMTRDVTYSSAIIQINFWLCYFDFLPSAIASTLALAPVFAKRAIYHSEPGLELAMNFVMASLW